MNARRLSCRAPSIIAQSITRIFMRRLFTLLAVFQSPHIYIIQLKNDFLIDFFQTLAISSIYVKAFKSRRFRLGLTSSALGFGFYIFIYLMINKYITSRALVNWAKKILKKNLKKS